MAIVFDAASSNSIINSSSTSITTAHTCTGSNLILFVSIATFDVATGTPVSGITYAGVAMTKIAEVTPQVDDVKTSLWYLIAPATGANNIVASFSAQTYIWTAAASYTGALQSGVPDASSSGVGTGTSISGTVTTIADNCWTVMDAYALEAGHTNGAGTTIRATSPTNGRVSIADSNAAKTPAGSVTLAVNCTSGALGHVIASFAPALASATHRGFFGFMGM